MLIKGHWLTGNVSVSLFWEEKFFIIARILQLYSFFFLTYYDFWPQSSREWFTPMFSGFVL